MILRWPGVGVGVRSAFHYQIDVTATILELLGGAVPERWHGKSFAGDLRAGDDVGRSHLVVSQAAWACQRGVRFDDWIYLETSHDAFHLYDDPMLFDLRSDPHEQTNRAGTEPEVVARAAGLLRRWREELLPGAARGRDPHEAVMAEGGPFHVRGRLPDYLNRLRDTGRSALATQLEQRWGG
jgi:arylsulfatase A-like enzyme